MRSQPFRLAVFDIAGTLIRDKDEVLHCLHQAGQACGLGADLTRLRAFIGVSKLEAFQTLWREQLGPEAPETLVQENARAAFARFREILEAYFEANPVELLPGVEELFAVLRANGVKIALDTGFYRKVADILLRQLGWDKNVDAQYLGGPGAVIDFSIASDQVPQGRPAPFMIRRAMEVLGIEDSRQVIKIGDTPVDLQEGRNAGVGMNLGVCHGNCTRAELSLFDNDGLFDSLYDIKKMLKESYSF